MGSDSRVCHRQIDRQTDRQIAQKRRISAGYMYQTICVGTDEMRITSVEDHCGLGRPINRSIFHEDKRFSHFRS